MHFCTRIYGNILIQNLKVNFYNYNVFFIYLFLPFGPERRGNEHAYSEHNNCMPRIIAGCPEPIPLYVYYLCTDCFP